MALYAGIDLHSNNNVVVVQDDQDQVVRRARLPNELRKVRAWLEPFRAELVGVVVESTYNWYWLVDGLMEAGHTLHLANTVAIQQYEGLKYRDDSSDARWLAKLLRLGQLPEGHIYPREQRAVRDLLRKRTQLVRQATMNLLSMQNLFARNDGKSRGANAIKRLTAEEVSAACADANLALAMQCNLRVFGCLQEQIETLEAAVLSQVKLLPAYRRLVGVPGIGKILALTIMLETGDIGRFATVGRYVSYCRLVGSRYISNQKRKGAGNTKNGNAHLCWAYIEAANFGVRYSEPIRRYYQRKAARTKRIVALKAVGHKLSRACYHVIRDGVAFDLRRAFGGEARASGSPSAGGACHPDRPSPAGGVRSGRAKAEQVWSPGPCGRRQSPVGEEGGMQ